MKTNIYKNIFLIPIFFIASLSISIAQQNGYDARIGIHAGIMNYYGDLNGKFLTPNNESRDLNLDFLSYGVSAERNLSSSWAAKIQYNRGQFIANDRAIKWDGSRDFENSNDERSLNARTDINDFSLMFTYYTDNGKLLSKNALISPYISFGVGLTLFEVFADLRSKNGSPYYYWADNTIRDKPNGSADATIIEQDGHFETNVTALRTEKDYNTSVLNIPLAAGLKFRLADRLNLNLDYTFRYTFTDYLDDVSGAYRDEYSSSMQAYAANPTNALAEQRGNDDGNDMYAFASISLHYSFGKKQQAFEAPVINYSERYDQTFPRTTFEEVEKVSVAKRNSITGSEKLTVLSGEPDMDRNIREVERLPASKRNERVADERELRALERADTLDSLYYLVEKQSLENELYALRLTSPDPEVRLKTKEDSLKTTREYETGGRLDMEVEAYDTLSVRKEQLDQQLKDLERSLERIVADSVRTEVAMDTVFYADSTRYIADTEYSGQIDSLENEIARLQNSGLETSEAELDSLQNVYELEKEELQARIAAMEADTMGVDTQARQADSVAIAELQERYAILEQRLQADSATDYERQSYTEESGYRPSAAENERINELQREIQNLKREREYSGYARENITVESRESDYQGNRRIDGLEREVDRLRDRNNTVAISATPAVGRNEADNTQMEEEIEQTQQMVDSLQQQIAALSVQTNAPATNADSAAVNAEVEALKQEISVLRANIVDMDADNAAPPEKVVIPEMPKTEVFFGVGVSSLSESDKERIGTLINFLKRYPEAAVELRGYTDPTGSASRNLVLSKRRAESVKQVLIEEGIAAERISTEFFGADNTISGNLVYGRRVEIIIE